MNQTELLDQFVIEARECLEAIGQRLLEVERSPTDAALLNDLFRSVHTLKGNCGLFEFKPLEHVVHAAEDLLDRVRNRTLDYSAALADALLEAIDFSAEMIDQIERSGRIPDGASQRSQPLATALRALLGGAPGASVPPGSHVGVSAAPHAAGPAAVTADAAPASGARAGLRTRPQWLERLAAARADAPAATVALHYQPEPDCFFKGEDPWRLVCTTPGLLQVDVAAQEPWPAPGDGVALDALDCYRCNLDLVLLSNAPLAEVKGHFRCVPEQVDCVALSALAPAASSTPNAADAADAAAATPTPGRADTATLANTALQQRGAAMWADQLALLARPALNAGTGNGAGVGTVGGTAAGAVAGAARSLRGLLLATDHAATAGRTAAALQALEGLPRPLSAAALIAWAQQHRPGAAAPSPSDASGASAEAAGAAMAGTGPANATARSGSDEGGGERHSRVLKVGQEKIDRLMDLIGEMVVAKNSLPYLAQRAEDVFGQRELSREIKAQYAVINRIAEDLQHAIMQVRMLPVGTVFQRFGRLVRDISKKLGKDVQMVVEGEDTEADKNVIEPLADPLIHILRNSLDHGIELPEVRRAAGKPLQGTIRIVARQESDRVIIEISDDGAGVNPQRVRDKAVERGLIPADRAATLSDNDAVQLVFLPGFSTAETISDLSGRGVGMDVVRTAVERINGAVALSSRHGHGTTIRLSLPLSMAVTNVMVIESAGRRFGVPMDLIVETVRVHADDIHHFKSARTTVLRGRIVPLRALNDLLSIDDAPLRNAEGEHAVLVVRLGAGSVGLLVDQFHGASDIILKPLEGVLAGLTGFAGTALMGNGSVLMVLNPKELL
jgi:two-component system chemotaxis sensor kinase CheA